MQEELQNYIGKEVVIDTKSPYLFLGTLEKVDEHYITLTNADVHDHSEFNKTKEIYILEAVKYGIKVNRTSTKMVKAEMISISLLEEVVKY